MFRHLIQFARVSMFAALVSAALPAQAYFSTMSTGDVTGVGQYRATLEPQAIINRYDGLNLIGRLETGIAEGQSAEALVGFGEVDFQLGAFYRWVPFPDIGNQPAIGGKAGVIYAKANDDSQFSLRFHPMISKTFETSVGDLSPYASLPLGVTIDDDDTFVPVQLALGTEWKTLNFEQLRFMGEIGFDLSKAFSYISFGLVFTFDEAGLRGQ